MTEDEFINNVFSPRNVALSLLAVLEMLRADDRGAALELLEQQLDNAVLGMGPSVRGAGSQERERISQALRLVRDYREGHPRQSESDKVNADAATLAGLLRIQERVRRILNGTEG